MRKDLVAYIVLLVISLSSAYYFSLPSDKENSKKVEWIKINPKAITQVTFLSEDLDVRASRMQDVDGYWIKIDRIKEPEESKKKYQEFRASKKFIDLIEDYNPYFVIRVIGEVKNEDLEEFGLKEPKSTFQIKTGDRISLEFKIGKKSYGSKNIFVFDTTKKKVVLISSTHITKMQKAKRRLFENKLYHMPLDEISRVKILAAEKTKTLSHTRRDGAGQLQWSDEGEKGKIKGSYKSWMNKINKLKVLKYSTDDETKSLTALNPFLELSMEKNEKESINLKFKKLSGDKETSFWVMSSRLGRYARVVSAKADAIEKDIPTILGQ